MIARPVSDAQWAALDLVCRRAEADDPRPTYVVARPYGDAAITTTAAAALARRGLITTDAGVAWPSPAGTRAIARRRRTAPRPADTSTAQG